MESVLVPIQAPPAICAIVLFAPAYNAGVTPANNANVLMEESDIRVAGVIKGRKTA